MAYTINQIKVFAYNCDEKDDFTISEFNLFCGIAYAYEWYRANPDDKDQCQKLIENYIDFYTNVHNEKAYIKGFPLWLDRKCAEQTDETIEEHSTELTEKEK